MKCHVEDPNDPTYELVCVEDDFGNYEIMAQLVFLSIDDNTCKESEGVWRMHFDGS